MTVVRAEGIEQRFGSTRVLTSVDLGVDEGERVTITGANGSGKTTLLRILAGLLRPSGGEVTILGRSTQDPDVRRRVGVISHLPALYARMSATENIRFWAGLYGDRSAIARGESVLAELGLDPADGRAVSSYSQGMRQRAAVARALATEPDLVLADEPFASLDAEGTATVASVLARVPTVVTATHEASPLGTRHLLLRDGRLVPA